MNFEFLLKILFIVTMFSVIAVWTWEFLFIPIFEYILELRKRIQKILKRH